MFTCLSCRNKMSLHQSPSACSLVIWIINCYVTVRRLGLPLDRLSRDLQIYDDALFMQFIFAELDCELQSHRGTLFAPRVKGNRSILSQTIYFRSPWSAIGAPRRVYPALTSDRSIDRTNINYAEHVTPAETLYFSQRPRQNSNGLSVVNLKNMHHISFSLALSVRRWRATPFNPRATYPCNS